ncbi:unnamed protein product [Cyprideis torosa]|uniref:Uncharacterized protein n=1 Tax=Cyprideis torosa TaxID=163714 RepID=A0A7R8ZTB7_9CRUS|nr:unnamed protein product [Cyprideis torosa]CAG0907353.1 unnamed protein product [Cyprideis torosa]
MAQQEEAQDPVEPTSGQQASDGNVDGGLEVDLEVTEGDDEEIIDEPLPIEDIRLFADVFEKIKNGYVEEIDDRELIVNAIRGMLNGLDPHSQFFDANDYDEFREDTDGEFGGIGIELSVVDGEVRVIAPIDDTPAAEAGLQPGDLIRQVDGTPMTDLFFEEIIKRLRGEPGTQVTLSIQRNGDAPFDVVLTRAIIASVSVKSRLIDGNYGLIRIAKFQNDTSDATIKAVEKLKSQARDGRLKGVLLDLRNNGGGQLDTAIEVADVFLAKGDIVHIRGRISRDGQTYSADDKDLTDGARIAVLINGGSASAAEIVAGALQDNQRAVVVGTRSFGKASVQTIVPLIADNGLKITTARYYTPNERSIQARGIVPDISIPQVRLPEDIARDYSISERDLANHLEAEPVDLPDERSEEDKKLLFEDFQLNEALSLLKALDVLAQDGTSETKRGDESP